MRVYARVDPAQKIQIVEALQDARRVRRHDRRRRERRAGAEARGYRRRDGQSGTDVAREAADMILLDDNFATIVAAVREGRRIYDNIRKFVRYVMTCNSGEIWTMFLAPLLGLPIAAAADPDPVDQPRHRRAAGARARGRAGRARRHARPPRPPSESIFARGLWQHVLWVGLLMGGGLAAHAGLGLFTSASPHWQSMVFTVLTLVPAGHVLAIRSERESLFTLGLHSPTGR